MVACIITLGKSAWKGWTYSILVHSLTERHLHSFYFRAVLWSTTTTVICPNFSVETYFLFWSRWVNRDYSLTFWKVVHGFSEAYPILYHQQPICKVARFLQPSLRMILTQSKSFLNDSLYRVLQTEHRVSALDYQDPKGVSEPDLV